MAFYNSFNGDESSLKLIQNNIGKKSILIPGISCQAGADLSSLGDLCYYFKRANSSLIKAKAGKPINYNSSGVKRAEFQLEDAIQFGDIIPVVNAHSTVNVVEDRLRYQILEAQNLHNKLAIEYLAQHGTDIEDYSDLSDNNAYEKLIDAIEAFKLKNKAKGLEPTAVFVSNACAQHLFKDIRFLRFQPQAGDYEFYNNVIGKIGKAFVFEAPDLDDEQDYDFVIVNAEGFVAPINVQNVTIQPAANFGYPSGKIIAGELRYGFSIANTDLVLVKKNKLSLKKPVPEFAANLATIGWAAVQRATGYIVDDDGVEQASQTGRSYELTYSTTEKYVRVKAVSTDPDSESTGLYSDKLFYQKRTAPLLEKFEDNPSVKIIDGDEFHEGYDLYLDGVLVEEDIETEYFTPSRYAELPGTYAFTVKAIKFLDDDGKAWGESDASLAYEYVIEEPEEPVEP